MDTGNIPSRDELLVSKENMVALHTSSTESRTYANISLLSALRRDNTQVRMHIHPMTLAYTWIDAIVACYRTLGIPEPPVPAIAHYFVHAHTLVWYTPTPRA